MEPLHPFLVLKRKRELAAAGDEPNDISSLPSSKASSTRTCMKLKDGDHEVIETNDGNIEVDGEILTFENWSKLSGSNDNDVCYFNKEEFENKVMPTPTILTVQAAPRKRFHPNENASHKIEVKRRRAPSEEGEICTSSESSSSEDENLFQPNNSQARRSANRKQLRQNAQNGYENMKRKMQALYDHRHDIVNCLSINQKFELLQSLRMVHENHDDVMKSKVAFSKFLCQP